MKIKFNKNQIEKFEKLGVKTIYLFGSQASGKTNPLSDYDIGVVLNKPDKDKTLEIYSELYKIFTNVLPREYLRRRFKMREHEFDLTFLQFAPFHFQFNAIKDGQVLFEKKEDDRLNYEEYVMKKNADLKYFYDLQDKAILERI